MHIGFFFTYHWNFSDFFISPIYLPVDIQTNLQSADYSMPNTYFTTPCLYSEFMVRVVRDPEIIYSMYIL